VQWNGVEVSAVKCETIQQIERAKQLASLKIHSSIDSPFYVYKKWAIADFYTTIIIAFFCPPLLILWPMLVLSFILPIGLNLLYLIVRVPRGGDDVPRMTWEWKLHCAIQFILSLPQQAKGLWILSR
jgi:hypothetical protein